MVRVGERRGEERSGEEGRCEDDDECVIENDEEGLKYSHPHTQCTDPRVVEVEVDSCLLQYF
jgi:hypothetical protein